MHTHTHTHAHTHTRRMQSPRTINILCSPTEVHIIVRSSQTKHSEFQFRKMTLRYSKITRIIFEGGDKPLGGFRGNTVCVFQMVFYVVFQMVFQFIQEEYFALNLILFNYFCFCYQSQYSALHYVSSDELHERGTHDTQITSEGHIIYAASLMLMLQINYKIQMKVTSKVAQIRRCTEIRQ